MAEEQYQRLTRARTRAGFAVVSAARSSLWLGTDHLLCVVSTGYSENYKRFYFRDIQAIVIQKTERRKVWNWALGTPTVICLAVWGFNLLLSRGSIGLGANLMGTIGTLAFALPLAINNALGPTTIGYLRTAVQTEELPSLSRLRRVRRVLARLRPLITQAQGQLAPEEISARMRELAQSPASAADAGAEPVRYVADDPSAPPRILP